VRRGRYLGIAPTASGLANVCLVIPYAAARAIGRSPAAALLGIARRDPDLGARFAAARTAGPGTVLGPMARDVATPGVPGLLLAGDAAGFIDPMTGDGLRFALAGAEMAAAVGAGVLAGRVAADAAPALLGRERRARLAGKWRFNRAVRLLVSSPAVGLAGAAARIWPGVFERLVCYAGDVGHADPALEGTCPSQ
jgi:flavin-dependent dehydrogenase